jgi:hypothetical protein
MFMLKVKKQMQESYSNNCEKGYSNNCEKVTLTIARKLL